LAAIVKAEVRVAVIGLFEVSWSGGSTPSAANLPALTALRCVPKLLTMMVLPGIKAYKRIGEFESTRIYR